MIDDVALAGGGKTVYNFNLDGRNARNRRIDFALRFGGRPVVS